MASKDLTNHELPLSRRPDNAAVSLDLVRVQRTAESALALSVTASGLDDKEIYIPLGIDAGHWSRIKKGEAGFPPNKVREFCHLVGNTIYPEWIAYQVGCQLVMIQSEAERKAEEAIKRAQDAENQVRLLRDILSGKAA